MNEYRVPEKNVQNGVLKAFSFLFEYIGELGKDYCNSVIPLLEDALMDRDVIHRQIACNVVRHMALGVVGLDCEPALLHLLNFVWPNVFESLPHTVNSCVEVLFISFFFLSTKKNIINTKKNHHRQLRHAESAWVRVS